MRKRLFLSILVLVLCQLTPLHALEIQVTLSPSGGFAPVNNGRKITVNGTEQPLSLNNALLDLIQKTPASGAIKLAMYNFSHKDIFSALVDKALKDGVQVRVLLDNAAEWTNTLVKDFTTSVDKVARKAAEDKRTFDFQVKLTTLDVMRRHKRTRVLDDGKEIFGSMHEKFGIFYDDRNQPPTTSFGGSANICPSSDEVYAENRIYFYKSPETAAVWAAQFARLWNEYSDPGTTGVASEPDVKIEKRPEGFEMLFNLEPTTTPGSFTRIDERVISLLDEVTPDGSVDIAMFSFTHGAIADKILQVAEKNPGAKIRLFFDHTMLLTGPDRRGLMPPMIEDKVKEKKMANVEIRYKFRANAYTYDAVAKEVVHDHFRAPLLHHKFMVINKKKIITGSYNWSSSAEFRNIEDDLVFDAANPFGKDVIDRYLAEFDFLWGNQYEARHAGADIKPYSIAKAYALEEEKKIKEALSDFAGAKIQKVLDDGPLTSSHIRNLAKLGHEEFNKAIEKMKAAHLVESYTKGEIERWRLTD